MRGHYELVAVELSLMVILVFMAFIHSDLSLNLNYHITDWSSITTKWSPSVVVNIVF